MHEGGGNCVKGGGTERRGVEIKNLKREGKLGQGVGALKRMGGMGGAAGASLQTMVHFLTYLLKHNS